MGLSRIYLSPKLAAYFDTCYYKGESTLAELLKTCTSCCQTALPVGLSQCCPSLAINCMQSSGLQTARLLCSWNFPGKNTGVACHFLLQGIFLTHGLNLCLLCLLHCGQPIIFTLSRTKCAILFCMFKNVITSACKSSLLFLTPTCSINLICYFLGKIYLNQF